MRAFPQRLLHHAVLPRSFGGIPHARNYIRVPNYEAIFEVLHCRTPQLCPIHRGPVGVENTVFLQFHGILRECSDFAEQPPIGLAGFCADQIVVVEHIQWRLSIEDVSVRNGDTVSVDN